MLTYEELMSWEPAVLAESADKLNSDRKSFIDLQDEVDHGKPPGTWTGDSADSAGISHKRLQGDLNDIAAGVSPVIDALDTAAEEIKQAQSSARDAMGVIKGHGWVADVSAGGTVVVSDPIPIKEAKDGDTAEEEAESIRKQMKELGSQIADALAKADAADAALATVLRNVKGGQYDGGTGSIRDATLPPKLRGLSGKALIDELMKDPGAYGGYVDALPVADQKALADRIADELGPLADGREGHEFSGEMPMSEAELKKLTEAVHEFGGDPTVATRIANDVGSDGVMNIQQAILGRFDTADGPDGYDPETIGASQRAWGNLIATATSGIESDNAGPTDEHVSANWAKNLIERGETEFPTNTMGEQMLGYKLLGPLLRDDDHGTWFLNQAGDSMEKFEQDYRDEHGELPWDATQDPRQIDFTHGETEVDLGVDRDAAAPGDTDSKFTQPSGHDPMGGLFEGLSHNPEAAREFFTNPTSEGKERVDYYMAEREWPSHSTGDEADSWPTGERYLGDAIVTATTEDVSPESGKIATAAFEAAERRIVPEHDDPNESGKKVAYEGLPPELRRSMAHVASAYMPDVWGAISDGSIDPNQGPLGSRTVSMDLGNLGVSGVREVLGDIGRDEIAYNTTRANADAYLAASLDKELPGDTNDLETSVIDPYANVRAALEDGFDKEQIAQGYESDTIRSGEGDGKWKAGGWVAEKVLSEGTGKIPFVGGAIGDAGKMGIDEAEKHFVGMNDIDSVSEIQEQIASRSDDSRVGLQGMIDAAVYRNLPADSLPPELLNGGKPIPMDQWTPEQEEAWSAHRSTTATPAFQAATLLERSVDQMENAREHGDTERGEG